MYLIIYKTALVIPNHMTQLLFTFICRQLQPPKHCNSVL